MDLSRIFWITDPGHGWLVVPMEDVHTAGCAEQITAYSYQSRDGQTAYLEEDCDAGTFIDATGIEYEPGIFPSRYTEGPSPRNLPTFSPPRATTAMRAAEEIDGDGASLLLDVE
jgi:hypothetical protein